MLEIVVTDEQVKIITDAKGPVKVVDAAGHVLGIIVHSPRDETPEEIEAMKRRARTPGPVYTTEEVIKHLRSFDTK